MITIVYFQEHVFSVTDLADMTWMVCLAGANEIAPYDRELNVRVEC